MQFHRQIVPSLLLLTALAVTTPVAADVDYERNVKPILARHCYECHSAAKQQAGLRVDTAALAIQGGDGGAAIVPGKAADSRLMQAVTGTSDEISQMPLDSDPLTPAEIETLRAWIDSGAAHPEEVAQPARIESDHWAFQPITRPDVPSMPGAGNPIDAFILRRLSDEQLTGSPEADRRTLIRRLYLDLLGLLPTPSESEDFVDDPRPDAYERLVDRVFASPRYGERWGRHWLDAARYADSNGFTIDGPRTMWPYRDWVIAALNADLPFDRFTIEQLAGDMLEDPTTEQLVATGFHRNTLANEEGGTDDEQFRVESVVDRVNTTGTVWMGLTVGCAQCHDHKYDPISQRDYYRLFAVFNNTSDNNDAGGLAPKVELPTPRQIEQRKQLNAALADAKQRKKAIEEALEGSRAEWEANLSAAAQAEWQVVDPLAWSSQGGAEITKLEDRSLLVGGTTPEHDVYEVSFRPQPGRITAIRLEVLTHASLPKTGPGLAGNGNFVLTGIACERRASDGEPAPVTFADALADHSQDNYPIANALDGSPETGWAINVKSGNLNVDRTATLFLTSATEANADDEWIFRLRQESPRNKTYQIGRFRISVTGAEPEALRVPQGIRDILAIAAAERSQDQQDQLAQHFRQTDEAWRAVDAEITKTESDLNAINKSVPTSLILSELPQPRESYVHVRGDFLRQGAPVDPGVPAVLPAPDAPQVTRLELARWLVSTDHPLTARVVVNRIWQRLFGRGLVETENDFGTQGAAPTHPELLEWLAAEIVQQEWSVKALQRTIVTSATYRQSSRLRPELVSRDPRNRMLARQSRIRLEAETIRDVCLSAAGVLSGTMGGEPVYPPQPDGIYAFTQNRKPWPESQGDARYRRGLYTYFWRSSPHPLLPTFDAPDANGACTRRVRSNTPLQALTLANDRAFVEFSQLLARRVLRDADPDTDARLAFAFACALGRAPTATEAARIREFLDLEASRFASAEEMAEKIAPSDVPGGIAPAEAAAWVSVSRVLLNLDEFITRE